MELLKSCTKPSIGHIRYVDLIDDSKFKTLDSLRTEYGQCIIPYIYIDLYIYIYMIDDMKEILLDKHVYWKEFFVCETLGNMKSIYKPM